MTHIYELPDAPERTDNLPHGVQSSTDSVVPVPLCHDGSEDY